MSNKPLRLPVILLALLPMLMIGCSGWGANAAAYPTVPDEPGPANGAACVHSLWGMWSVSFDPDKLVAQAVPIRNARTHYNITGLVLPPSCDNCLDIHVQSFDPLTRIIEADVTLRNTYKVTGHDVRGIVFTDDYGHDLLNADAWTELFDIPGGDLINPFRAFAPLVPDRAFVPDAEHTERFSIYLPEPPHPPLQFAVECSFSENCEEPYDITAFSQDPIYNYTGSSGSITIAVFDWQTDVHEVTLEAPEITGEDISYLSPIPDFTWTMTLTNNTGAPAGTYRARIKAISSGSGDLALYDFVEIHIRGGISEDYPGDDGIDTDPHVIFVEDFQESSLPELFDRWEEVKNPENMSFSDHVPPGSAGDQSLLVTHVGGQGTGAHLYRRLLPGYNLLHFRFYVKFDPDCGPIHHFFHAGGYNPSTPWPQGGAGIRPTGDERFTTGVEPFGNYDPWRWDFYSYWMEMRGCPDGNFWGNDFINDPNLGVEMGTWTCLELMMKLNDPVTASNGEMALWINGQSWTVDGQIVSYLGEGFPNGGWVWDSWIPDPDGDPFDGFRWRSDPDLNINFLWLLVYITQATPGHISEVWYDQVVVANHYIGPIKPD